MPHPSLKYILTGDSNNPTIHFPLADEISKDYKHDKRKARRWLYLYQFTFIPNQQATHHRHQLRDSSVRHSQFINNSRKHEGYPPATNAMGNPQQRKRDNRRVTEQGLNFIPLKGFCFHGGSVSGETVQNGLFFGFGEKLGCFRVWFGLLEDIIEVNGASKHTVREEEEGVNPTENGRDAFYYKNLLTLIYILLQQYGW